MTLRRTDKNLGRRIVTRYRDRLARKIAVAVFAAAVSNPFPVGPCKLSALQRITIEKAVRRVLTEEGFR